MLRYKEVKQMLMKRIVSMRSGERLPSRTDLSRLLDSSRATIDKAIQELIDEGVLEARFGSGTYVSKQLKGVTSNVENWCLIVPDISEGIYAQLASGVEKSAHLRGTNVILCNSESSVEKQADYINRMIGNQINGFIIVPSVTFNAVESTVLYQSLQKASVPFVFCNREVEGVYAPIIKSNDFIGGYIATRKLLENGYHNVAYISAIHYRTSMDRCQGYISALQRMKVPIERRRILMQTKGDLKACMKRLRDLLLSTAQVDALFCFDDETAIAALELTKSLGLRVPEDVGIIGYNNTEGTYHSEPPLSSMDYGAAEVGQRAAWVLGKLIDGDELSGFPYYLIEPHFVEKASCRGPAVC